MSYPGDQKHLVSPSSGLPVYHIDESTEVLVVGGEQPTKGCCRHNRAGCRSKVKRFFKFLFASFLVLFITGAAFHHFHRRPVPLFCNDITSLEPITVDIPLGCPRRPAHLLVHSSLAGEEAKFVHDESVPVGKAVVTIEFAKESALPTDAAEEEPPVFCAIKTKRGIGLGVWSLTDAAVPKVAKTVIRYSSKVGAPAARLIGDNEFKFLEKHVKRLIKWWKKKHDKEEEESK